MFKEILNILLIFSIAFSIGQGAPSRVSAPDCHEKCKLPECRCSSADIPGGLRPQDTPQFVLLTFDDAVTIANIGFYRTAMNNRKNVDGCPVAATYFVSHEYTDYTLVSVCK